MFFFYFTFIYQNVLLVIDFMSLVIYQRFILFYCRKGSIIADFAVNVRLFRADTDPTQIGIELKEKTDNLSKNGSLGDVPLTECYIEDYTFNILDNGMHHS